MVLNLTCPEIFMYVIFTTLNWACPEPSMLATLRFWVHHFNFYLVLHYLDLNVPRNAPTIFSSWTVTLIRAWAEVDILNRACSGMHLPLKGICIDSQIKSPDFLYSGRILLCGQLCCSPYMLWLIFLHSFVFWLCSLSLYWPRSKFSVFGHLTMWYCPPCCNATGRPSPDAQHMLVPCSWTSQLPMKFLINDTVSGILLYITKMDEDRKLIPRSGDIAVTNAWKCWNSFGTG